MKRSRFVLVLLAAAGLAAPPAAVLAMGSGGMGASSMPSMPQQFDQPQYDPVVEYQRGSAALQAGRYKDAIRAFDHVVDATPRAADAWLMLGMSKSGAGDVRGAEKAYQRSVKLDGGSIDAHRELALSEIRLKQPAKAGAELAALQARAATCAGACPDAAGLEAAITAIKAALAPPAPQAAKAAPAPLSLASPQQGDGDYVRAVSLINERRFGAAMSALDKAELAIGPHPDILTYKGYVWRRLGDWPKAEDYYRQALAIDPNHRGATEYYGELKVLEGDTAGARAMLARLDGACSFGCAEAEELRRWIDHGGDPAS
ncbi:MAG TPA: tetratricopeptide repeat protein [Caulobacteraceae bacterium]|nr:tetratricopeptide repeat protein [Caulobacteraceae bacterium]